VGARLQLSLSHLDGEVVERFDDVKPGTHTLGRDDDCGLLVTAAPCPGKLCRVHVAFDHEVHVLSAGVAQIRSPEKQLAARQPLPPGAYVDVEGFRLTLLAVREAKTAPIQQTGSVAPPTKPAPGLIVAPRGEPVSLEWQDSGRDWRHDVETDAVLVGRGERTEDERTNLKRAFIQLDQEEISRNHLLLFRSPAGWMIKALDSLNGTWVNGEWLAPGSTRSIDFGSLVEVTRLQGYPTFLFSTRERALMRPRGAKPHTRLVGRHEAMAKVRAKLDLYGKSKDVIVLILGDTGTGKELAAQALHAAWCPDRPFLAANCGAFTATLIESELFGHEKGAYTGAERRRIGLFESAQGGVVFLDEIGELSLPAQVKLLRVLQENKVTRVGSNEALDVNYRLVCATHRGLYEMTKKGTFREDLYNRIAEGEVLMPSLAERASDIPLLARTYLEGKRCELTPAAATVLQGHAWPGNVRQLQNALDRSLAESGRTVLDASDLVIVTEGERRGMAKLEAEAREAAIAAAGDRVETLEEVDLLKRGICERAVREAKGNKSEAARALGINVRTFNDWLKAWGI